MTNVVDALMRERPDRDFEAVLPRDARAQFEERGFIRIERITTDEEIVWLRRVYDELFGGAFKNTFMVRDVMTRVDEQRGERISQIIRPELNFPQLLDTVFWRNGRRLAAQLLGLDEQKLEGWGHMVRKAPRDTEALPYHQDEAFWDPRFDYRALGVWMPLDPATVESGCMTMIPGSHKAGIAPHRLGKDDPAVTYIEVIDPPAHQACAHPVEIGGASFHDCRTIHGSGANASDHVRRAYINEFQAPPAPRAIAHDRPWFWARETALMSLAKDHILTRGAA